MNILIIFTSYLLGSLPTGFLIGKYLKNIDLRTMGSGSTGATNVLRNVGKWPALFVFIIDVGKGFIAVKIAQYYTDQVKAKLKFDPKGLLNPGKLEGWEVKEQFKI